MKIAIDIRHLALPNPSGIGYYTKHLVEEMARIAPDDTFLLLATGTPTTLSYTPSFDAPNIRVIKKRKGLIISRKAARRDCRHSVVESVKAIHTRKQIPQNKDRSNRGIELQCRQDQLLASRHNLVGLRGAFASENLHTADFQIRKQDHRA